MKYNESSHIQNVQDVEKFFGHIAKERKINFHPDNGFEEYINKETHVACFTPEEVDIYNRLMEESFAVCEKEDVDIYAIGLKSLGLEWMLEDVA